MDKDKERINCFGAPDHLFKKRLAEWTVFTERHPIGHGGIKQLRKLACALAASPMKLNPAESNFK
jgi:hypothetical protein